MPDLVVFMSEGRTTDQKRVLVRKVTDAFVEALGVKPESVGIQIVELKDENFARNGLILPDRR